MPDVMNSVYEYPQKFIADIYVNLGNSHGISGTVIMGSEGTLIMADRGQGLDRPVQVSTGAADYHQSWRMIVRTIK